MVEYKTVAVKLPQYLRYKYMYWVNTTMTVAVKLSQSLRYKYIYCASTYTKTKCYILR